MNLLQIIVPMLIPFGLLFIIRAAFIALYYFLEDSND